MMFTWVKQLHFISVTDGLAFGFCCVDMPIAANMMIFVYIVVLVIIALSLEFIQIDSRLNI